MQWRGAGLKGLEPGSKSSGGGKVLIDRQKPTGEKGKNISQYFVNVLKQEKLKHRRETTIFFYFYEHIFLSSIK